MPYNEELDLRITKAVSNWGTAREKMFGGTCYILNGNMMCGVYKEYLILRLGKDQADKALPQKYVKEFDITGKPMKGWVMVQASGFKGAKLVDWLEKAKKIVAALPAK
ncbi:MAG: TfoX/Sxy family protein [Desulfobacterales bacterium]|nr:TfoX/Sxy family protein [Desulfobacterales bacterium]